MEAIRGEVVLLTIMIEAELISEGQLKYGKTSLFSCGIIIVLIHPASKAAP